MNYLLYISLNDGMRERVQREDIDASEQAGVIDRTLLPVLKTGQGWANSRKSGYRVTGEISRNAASFALLDEGVQIAVVAVSLHQKTSGKMWTWLHEHARSALPDSGPAPQPAWAALRYDVPEMALPPWLDLWAKQVGFALMTRDGW
jgi:hypothetical protein